MLKELKNLFYILVIFIFVFFTIKYYFSDQNKKKSYRSLASLDKKINEYAKKLPILKDDTNNIIKYVENAGTNNKKKYNFWKLLINDEK
tara:strand:- start:337 stop:603 length:267 start_codon:yes stop_codon:yes gene_type:complete